MAMERRRAGSPMYGLQYGVARSAPSSPANPLSVVTGGASPVFNRRTTEKAKAANTRLAQAMTWQKPEYDSYDDDDSDRLSLAAGGGGYRSRLPRVGSDGSNGSGSAAASLLERAAARHPSPSVISENPGFNACV